MVRKIIFLTHVNVIVDTLVLNKYRCPLHSFTMLRTLDTK
jgi:hypothetical protein